MLQVHSKYAKDMCSTWQVHSKFHAFHVGWEQNQAIDNLPTKTEAWWLENLKMNKKNSINYIQKCRLKLTDKQCFSYVFD